MGHDGSTGIINRVDFPSTLTGYDQSHLCPPSLLLEYRKRLQGQLNVLLGFESIQGDKCWFVPVITNGVIRSSPRVPSNRIWVSLRLNHPDTVVASCFLRVQPNILVDVDARIYHSRTLIQRRKGPVVYSRGEFRICEYDIGFP